MKDIVKESGGLLLSHDPFEELLPDELINMMDFFIEEEDYEKCSELRDIIKTIKAKHARKQEKDASKELGEVLYNVIRRTKSSKDSNS
jgi:metal-responsive CopG/Arc/MetJ family transcriptional regulator